MNPKCLYCGVVVDKSCKQVVRIVKISRKGVRYDKHYFCDDVCMLDHFNTFQGVMGLEKYVITVGGEHPHLRKFGITVKKTVPPKLGANTKE